MSCCFQPPFVAVTKDHEKQKPAIIRFYNYIKGETDIVDQKIRNYYVKPKSSKWTIAAFSYIFDVARINATTLSRQNQKSLPKHPQLMHLCLDGSWPCPWFNRNSIIVASFQMVCRNTRKGNRRTFGSHDWKTFYKSWKKKMLPNLLRKGRKCRSKRQKGQHWKNCFQMCKMRISTLCKPFSKDLSDNFQVNIIIAFCLYLKKKRFKKKLTMNMSVIYSLSCVWSIADCHQNIW